MVTPAALNNGLESDKEERSKKTSNLVNVHCIRTGMKVLLVFVVVDSIC